MTKGCANEPTRSACPLNATLECLGDQWSLLIVRDLLFRSKHTYKDFLHGGEGVSTNILADRLRRLTDYGIIEKHPDPADARRHVYRLTERGLELAPVLVEMILWGANHFETGAPPDVVAKMEKDPRGYAESLVAQFKQEG